MIRTQLSINVVHNQEAPTTQLTTQPATGPENDVQFRRVLMPTWTRPIDRETPFDLVILLTDDLNRWKRETDAYAAARGSKVTVVTTTPQAVVDAIIARKIELTTDPENPPKLRVLLAGHGNPQFGPVVGGTVNNPGSEYLFETSELLSAYEDDDLLNQYLQNTFPQTQLSRLRGRIRDLVFSNCEIASNVGARRVIDAIRQDLLIATITAGKMVLGTAWRKVDGQWVTEISAYTKQTTPIEDVLYVSAEP